MLTRINELKTWWKAWRELLLRFLGLAASFASLMWLLIPHLTWARLSAKETALLLVAGFALAFLVVMEFLQYRGNHVFAKDDKEGIKAYMHNWIKHGGRVAIWTRDMSWARGRDTTELLLNKAAQGELILCLPERNSFTDQLAEKGAEVCAYGSDRLDSPASRFTIIFFGRDGAQVAVGRAQGETHVIDEFDANNHPAFFLAEDLVALVRAKCANPKNQ